MSHYANFLSLKLIKNKFMNTVMDERDVNDSMLVIETKFGKFYILTIL